MFSRLPAFPALNVVSISLDAGRTAERVLYALGAAPNLTTLHFRIVLDYGDEDNYRQEFDEILSATFPWGHPESMKNVLTRKFPLIQQIGFYFYPA